ncbi:MAG: hypothetical protein OEL83_13355 [Desulforhopalus sp.]|nr:hypothetical protein [Desulforhopalus sp.]
MDLPHRWRFCRLGGFDQVRLESAEDIRHLGELDQKLWAALSCPVDGLEFDSRTLAMLDSDTDGRVRVPEILAATQWVSTVLASLDGFLAGADHLPLQAIDGSHAEGRQLIASAKRLLSFLGKADADSVSMEDVANTEALLHDSKFNGDGVITPNVSDDEAITTLISEIISCVGSDQDRSGQQGISGERLEAFFTAATQYSQWWQEARSSSDILPFGEQTEAAAAVFARLRTKLDDYFMRCGLAAYDSRAEAPLNPSLVTYEAIAIHDLTVASAEVESFPLAHIIAGQPLPLAGGINPAWVATVEEFTKLVVVPLFGESTHLQAAQWEEIKKIFLPYAAWMGKKAGGDVEQLGIARVEAILQSQGKDLLLDLINEDLQLAEEVEAIDKVAQLVHFNRDLYRLLNNFVSFRDFYSNDCTAVFQSGTLYIDGRSCELCIRVPSVETHSPLASLSRTYLAYCECRRRGSDQRIFIAAAFTGGDSDNLMLGRNGVFYDRDGKDWDATIVKIIDHPISVSQAFWAPYKRIGRMINEQIEKFAAAKDKAVDSKAATGIAGAVAKPLAPPPPPKPPASPPLPFDVGKFAGIFAAFGLALGAMGTAVASIVGVFLALPVWQMPLALAGLLLVVSGPSMLIAFLKLRQRNLGPILDANGWAVNTKACINIPFGATLTKMAVLPKGAERSLADPFAEKKTPWKFWVFLVVLVMALGFAWNKGYIKDLAKIFKAPAGTEKSATVQPAASAK